MTGLPASADAIVVGGGVVGAWIARALALAGLAPLCLEARAFGGAVTGGSLAAIGTHMHGAEEFDLLAHARACWQALSETTPDGMEYTRCGKLGFILSDAERAAGAALVDEERRQGGRAALLTPAEAQRLEPLLRGPILAATHDPDTVTVNPFLAMRALLRAARQAGAVMRDATPVARLRLQGGRIAGVETASGARIAAPHVVLACGPWTARLVRDLSLPVVPRQAQCLASVRQPPGTLRHVISSCEAEGGVDSGYTQIQQAASGQILFNTVTAPRPTPPGAEDHVGEVPAGFVADSVDMLLTLCPGLADLAILRSWVRFEAVTPDARFLAGPLPVPGLHVCAGDNGTGFCRAPVLAGLIAGAVTGAPSLPPALRDKAARLYDPGRFDTERAA